MSGALLTSTPSVTVLAKAGFSNPSHSKHPAYSHVDGGAADVLPYYEDGYVSDENSLVRQGLAGGVNNINNSLYEMGDLSMNVSGNGTENMTTREPYPWEEYDYDYALSISSIPLEELIPVALIYGLTLVLGVVGNVLVILAIVRNRRMQTVTNTFLTSLATADLLLVLLCVPVKFTKFFTFTWTFGEVMCKGVHYMQNVSVICSVLTMTGMSIERYYAIVHPMKAKFLCTVRRAQRVIIFVWVLSVILAVPILFGRNHKEVGESRKGFWCVKQWPSTLYSQMYELYMLLLIFLVPLAIIAYSYASICCQLCHMSSVRATMRAGEGYNRKPVNTQHPNGYRSTTKALLLTPRKQTRCQDDDRQRKQVVKMLVTVIALFALCWGPTLIDNVLVAFRLIEKYNYEYMRYLRQAFALMSYFNSCVNPVVYAFMSKNFRDSFLNTLCFGACTKERKVCRQGSFTTRTSTISMSRAASVKYDFDTYVNYEPGRTGHPAICRTLLNDSGEDKLGSEIESETGV